MDRPRCTMRPVPTIRPTFVAAIKLTLSSRVGANSPGPRVRASVGDNVSSSIAASIPPWTRPAGFKKSGRACISTLRTCVSSSKEMNFQPRSLLIGASGSSPLNILAKNPLLAISPRALLLRFQCSANCADTVPSPSRLASKVSPEFTGTIGPRAPESTMSPARNGRPRRPSSPASHATALSGLSRQAAPLPSETTSPRFVIRMLMARKSIPSSLRFSFPTTNRPDEALSAMVSTIEMFQFFILLPTISRAGLTNAVARITSLTVGLATSMSLPSSKAISASIRGCSTLASWIFSPSRASISAKRMPKSGRSTPNCF